MTFRPSVVTAGAARWPGPAVTPGPRRLVLALALCLLGGCQAGPAEPTAASSSGQLPNLGWPPPRMRAPSAERPPWLPTLPAELPRYPIPDSWRDTLG